MMLLENNDILIVKASKVELIFHLLDFHVRIAQGVDYRGQTG